jgi:hypothetical protein
MAAKINKSFWIDRGVARRFKAACAERECGNSDIVEMLMIKWLERDGKRKHKIDQRP